MNRKAYVFSTIALVAIIIVAAGLQLREERAATAQSALQTHILSSSSFLDQLEQDLPRVLAITGYRSLLGLEEHISSTGQYLDNLSDSFEQLLYNGTVNYTSYEVMEDTTLKEFGSRLSQIGNQLGVSINISVINVTLSHADQFTVRIETILEVNATTRDTNTWWRYEVPVTSEFSIQNLRDPLYSVGTLGRVPGIVRPVNISKPYILPNNDTSRLETIWNDTLYVNDTSAPSFLMRFEGNLSASEYGIASVVDTKLLDSQDITVKTDRSVVDFIYFGPSASSTNLIVNMSDQFLLDDDHLELFDAEDKVR